MTSSTRRKEEELIDLTIFFQEGQSLFSPDEHPDFVTAQLIVDCHCELGEGIIYDDMTHTVFWTDILGRRFHSLQKIPGAHSMKHTTFPLHKKLGSFGMLLHAQHSLQFLCAWEDGFQLYDIEHDKELSPYSTGEDVNPAKGTSRLNDGRVDPTGTRFICGGYYGQMLDVKMKVYKCERKENGGSIVLFHEPIADDFQVSNSINWSMDGRTMYLADSPTKQICALEYNSSTGTISGERVLHQKTPSSAKKVPDGSCVDSEGYLWNAVWRDGEGPGMVERIDPATGKVVFTVHMPDATSQVSCCCFGGENLDILFITTAGESRDKLSEPNAGGLYAAKVPFRGRKESRLDWNI